MPRNGSFNDKRRNPKLKEFNIKIEDDKLVHGNLFDINLKKKNNPVHLTNIYNENSK